MVLTYCKDCHNRTVEYCRKGYVYQKVCKYSVRLFGRQRKLEKDSADASAEPKLLGRRCLGSADSQNCSFVRSLSLIFNPLLPKTSIVTLNFDRFQFFALFIYDDICCKCCIRKVKVSMQQLSGSFVILEIQKRCYSMAIQPFKCCISSCKTYKSYTQYLQFC